MSVFEAARDHYLSRHAEFLLELGPEPGWLGTLRQEALACFAEEGFPERCLEEWRYTNVSPIAKSRFELPGPAGAGPDRERIEALSFPVFACGLFVFVNGRFRPDLSAPPALSAGIRVESLAELRAEAPERLPHRFGQEAPRKGHPFAALNTAFVSDGAVLRVPRGFQVEQPVHVVFVSTDTEEPAIQHPRLLIDAEPESRILVIQDHVTMGRAPGFSNAVSEVHVGSNAAVDLVVVQREHDAHFHVSGLHVSQERDSRFSSHTLTLGGALVRNDATVLLAEPGASCNLGGLFVGGGTQTIDNHTLVDHAVPHCASRELYKGVLGGRARGVFRGRVIVRPDAQKSNALQSNPNLLIGRGAEMYTKPQLEIYADDVRCSHGSSIGQLDADALFYLRCRALSLDHARDLLTRAFAHEVTNALPVPGLSEGLDALLLERLGHARGDVEAA
jgi:Fe-S cluster assembly protein SufD